MRVHTQPLSKTGVTRVTRVTSLAKRPASLAFTTVTHLSEIAFHRCNADHTCNSKAGARVLQVKVRFAPLKHDYRWLRSEYSGRGTVRYTLRAMGND